ncbi:NOL1/NOP2/sun family protein [Toxoplasma gondii MAS]|uniref:NOL1/NOP2/sun family protein n=2 Tax=Toxoplasma gondii TaxID=5811 RepID=A0A086QHP9_TOXGO|nr:NOL1/NOP2/sun family protein [Toxoplasma gondii MAS]PUA90074.1 NOL1/NOP2/sun family protein [Toxoplasma gondii TgCATBr9]
MKQKTASRQLDQKGGRIVGKQARQGRETVSTRGFQSQNVADVQAHKRKNASKIRTTATSAHVSWKKHPNGRRRAAETDSAGSVESRESELANESEEELNLEQNSAHDTSGQESGPEDGGKFLLGESSEGEDGSDEQISEGFGVDSEEEEEDSMSSERDEDEDHQQGPVSKKKRKRFATESEPVDDDDEPEGIGRKRGAGLTLSGGVVLDPSSMDLAVVKQRIEETLHNLANFVQFRVSQENKRRKSVAHQSSSKEDIGADGGVITRRQLIDQLAADIVSYYQYRPELVEYFLQLFKPQEAYAFFEANEENRPMTLRTNSLKTRRRDLAAALIARGCNVDPLGEWTKVGLKVYESTVPVGATPEYLAGHYMLQSAASLIPVMALAPQPGEKVVDMAAAPGGKTTYIAQLLKNEGILFANDAKKERCTSLMANLHRLGVTNCIVSCVDGRTLPTMLPPMDRALLDAPCTGSGIIARDPSIKVKRKPEDFAEHSKLQKQLLCAAVDAVNADSPTGGYIVYSTCSISVEENEQVVDYILTARNVKLVPLGVDIGVPGLSGFRGQQFHNSVPLYTRRFYPHVNNFDGFFVAKFKKLSNKKPERVQKDRRKHNPFVKVWDKEHWTPECMDQLMTFEEKETTESKTSITKENSGKGSALLPMRERKQKSGADRVPSNAKSKRISSVREAAPGREAKTSNTSPVASDSRSSEGSSPVSPKQSVSSGGARPAQGKRPQKMANIKGKKSESGVTDLSSSNSAGSPAPTEVKGGKGSAERLGGRGKTDSGKKVGVTKKNSSVKTHEKASISKKRA